VTDGQIDQPTDMPPVANWHCNRAERDKWRNSLKYWKTVYSQISIMYAYNPAQ